jgi:hypothetical protein
MLEDEVQSLQDALYHLNERQHLLEESLDKVESMIDEKMYYIQRQQRDNQSSGLKTVSGNESRVSPQAKTAATITPKGERYAQVSAGKTSTKGED